MTALLAALIGVGLFLLAGLFAAIAPARLTAALSAVAGAVVASAGLAVLYGAPTSSLSLAWAVPGGPTTLLLDPLAALFLVPIGVVAALGAVYAVGYWPASDHPTTERPLRAGYALLSASLCAVVLAHSGVAFLVAWELMAVSGFFLIATDHARPEVRSAAFVYLVAAHLAVLALTWMFARVEAATGVFGFAPLPPGPATTATVLLALLAFGLKAGFAPLHVWLPAAHAAAPTHVSALLSGVMLKVGIYGIARTLSLAPELPAAIGALVLTLGAISAVGGVAFALAQHDLKRLLAYHSIENIGIILLGLGLALIGQHQGRPLWVALGLAGALLHVINHALFKSLLFFGAGSVIHASATRTIDRLGGLAHRMPLTAATFVLGAVAICGLPPLNGFVSELFLYLGFFDAARPGGLAPLAALAPVLALVGGLAVACFVKVYGVVFLGQPRTPAAASAYEPPRSMLAPMLILAALCAAVGLFPALVAPALDRVLATFAPSAALRAAGPLPPLAASAPLTAISALALALLAALALLLARRRAAASRAPRAGTWACGYAAPTPRIQYTASSFADTILGLARAVLRPRAHIPRPDGPHPAPTAFDVHTDDTVLEGAVLPAFRRIQRALSRVRQLQSGPVQVYNLYILLALLALLASALPLGELATALWSPLG